MSLALVVAEGSALGQTKVTQFLPHGGMTVALLGVLATLLTMIWYLASTRARRRGTPARAERQAPAAGLGAA
jgi:hypothetical protein